MRSLTIGASALVLAVSCAVIDFPPPDAGPAEAGPDGDRAALDVPRDTRRLDSPDLPGDPEWAIPPGVRAECTVERARHPERLPALTWESCGEGCARADLGTIWNAVSAFRANGQRYYELLSDDFPANMRTDALAPETGPLVDAWRHLDSSDTRCAMFWYEAGGSRAAAMVTYIDSVGGRVELEDYFWTYDLETGPEDVSPDINLTPAFLRPDRHTQEYVVSSELAAFRIEYGQVVVSYGGELQQIFASTPEQGGYDLGVLGDHLTFLEAGTEGRIMHWLPDRGVEVLYDPVDLLQGLRQSGTTLAWARLMDFEGPLATRAELWTAELVRDPASFAPRLVNDRVEPDGVVGNGMYGWTQSDDDHTNAHLIDLDTGRHRVLSARPGEGCRLLLVSRDEVTLACGMPTGDGDARRSITHYDPDLHAVEVP